MKEKKMGGITFRELKRRAAGNYAAATTTLSRKHFAWALFCIVPIVILRCYFLPDSPWLPSLNLDHGRRGNDQQKKESLQPCDFSIGQWDYDPTPPLYDDTTCKTISEGQNCVGHGRPDTGYLYWRWQPSNCTLPRFDPATFLSLTANQKLLFVGDSMARNQVESVGTS